MTHERGWLVAAVKRSLRQAPAMGLLDVASACGVSRATLTRALNAEAGVSYRQVRQRCRCAMADVLLQETPTRSIKETAFALGFSSPGSFARWMKKATGHTPLERHRRLCAVVNHPDAPATGVPLLDNEAFSLSIRAGA